LEFVLVAHHSNQSQLWKNYIAASCCNVSQTNRLEAAAASTTVLTPGYE